MCEKSQTGDISEPCGGDVYECTNVHLGDSSDDLIVESLIYFAVCFEHLFLFHQVLAFKFNDLVACGTSGTGWLGSWIDWGCEWYAVGDD